jgi:hypothetical protein
MELSISSEEQIMSFPVFDTYNNTVCELLAPACDFYETTYGKLISDAEIHLSPLRKRKSDVIAKVNLSASENIHELFKITKKFHKIASQIYSHIKKSIFLLSKNITNKGIWIIRKLLMNNSINYLLSYIRCLASLNKITSIQHELDDLYSYVNKVRVFVLNYNPNSEIPQIPSTALNAVNSLGW